MTTRMTNEQTLFYVRNDGNRVTSRRKGTRGGSHYVAIAINEDKSKGTEGNVRDGGKGWRTIMMMSTKAQS